jgi:response regulator of citrate/malate metabolism
MKITEAIDRQTQENKCLAHLDAHPDEVFTSDELGTACGYERDSVRKHIPPTHLILRELPKGGTLYGCPAALAEYKRLKAERGGQ